MLASPSAGAFILTVAICQRRALNVEYWVEGRTVESRVAFFFMSLLAITRLATVYDEPQVLWQIEHNETYFPGV